MPAPKAEDHQAQSIARTLKVKGLAHLRARAYGSLIVIESGPKDDPYPRARLRRTAVHLWSLEMATHTGKWEKTPFRATLTELLDLMVDTFGWTLADD